MSDRKQTPQEEIANVITHGAGVVFCLVATPFLIMLTSKNEPANGIWAVSIFSFGMLMVYLSSTLYHAAKGERVKKALRVWDHISIFLLIAGTYTPVVYRYTDHSTSTVFLTVMWSIVALGIIKKLFLTGKYQTLSLILYLALGWMAVFIIKPLIHNVPNEVWYWLAIGGLCYTSGVIFYRWKKLQYHHAVWHCFVLAGTITHYVAIFRGASLPVVAG